MTVPSPDSLAPLAFGYGITVTFHTRTASGKDAYGNTTYTETNVDVPGCGFNPGGSVELVQGQDMVRTQPEVYAPPGTVVSAVDQVTVNGTRYDVDGQPVTVTNPFTGWQPPVVVRLKAVTG
ncbi:MAG: hypothetical protein ACXVGC_00140 [Mycobacteriaceae bacterium]